MPYTGDRACNHVKVDATLTPKRIGESTTVMGFEGQTMTAADLTAIRMARADATSSYNVRVLKGRDAIYTASADLRAVYVTPSTQQILQFSSRKGSPYANGSYRLAQVTVVSTFHSLSPTEYAVSNTEYYTTEYINPTEPYEKAWGYSEIYTRISYRELVDGSETIRYAANTALIGGLDGISNVRRYLSDGNYDPSGWITQQVADARAVKHCKGHVPYVTSTLVYDPDAFSSVRAGWLLDTIRWRKADALTTTRFANVVSDDAWSDLADEAISNCAYVDINTAAYIRDLRLFGNEVKGIIQLMENPANPKGWASLYLGARFGSRLTASDTIKLREGINRFLTLARTSLKPSKKRSNFLTVRARGGSAPSMHGKKGTVTRSTNYKVYYRPHDVELYGLINTLCNWDIWPSGQNVWDLLPYTFVLDWFIGIDKVLETLDRREYESRMQILGTTYSCKDVYSFPTNLGAFGYEDTDIKVTVYHRHTSLNIHQSVLRGLTGHASNVNILDGLALLIQRLL